MSLDSLFSFLKDTMMMDTKFWPKQACKHWVAYLCFSCISLISRFNSSILSAVSLRTITSSTVSTTSPFSPRFLLQMCTHTLLKPVMNEANNGVNKWRAYFGASVVSRSSEYCDAQCCKTVKVKMCVFNHILECEYNEMSS